MSTDPNMPILTVGEVEEWRKSKGEIEEQISTLQNNLTHLNRKIDAAAIIMAAKETKALRGTLVETVRHNGNGAAQSNGEEPLTHAVIRMLNSHKAPMDKPSLREALREDGFSSKRLGNYFYTVMGRLVEKGHISRNGDVYSLPFALDLDPEHTEAPSDEG